MIYHIYPKTKGLTQQCVAPDLHRMLVTIVLLLHAQFISVIQLWVLIGGILKLPQDIQHKLVNSHVLLPCPFA